MTIEQKAKAYDELKVKAQQIHLGFLGLKSKEVNELKKNIKDYGM
jgi:hypothetical protein